MSTHQDAARRAARLFEETFGQAPEAVGEAPGRVNLLGEHTDYNDGFVLPIAIAQRTALALARHAGPGTELRAHDLGRTATLLPGLLPDDTFARYVHGCLEVLRQEGVDLPPLRLLVTSDVPMGVGLSSSAALEVAALRALCAFTGTRLDGVRIAQLAQRAEVEHAGVRCGILDQMASSLASADQALWLDTRSLERRLVPLPPDAAVLVLDSGTPRSLATSGYNERRSECERAAALLGVHSLREVTDPLRTWALPRPLDRRVRHDISENARVQAAVEAPDARSFGALMNASHASLRDDYEVSVPALDRLVALLQAHPAVHGARLTGAGFGGACVALCRPDALAAVAREVLAAYSNDGASRGALLVPGGTDGSSSPTGTRSSSGSTSGPISAR